MKLRLLVRLIIAAFSFALLIAANPIYCQVKIICEDGEMFLVDDGNFIESAIPLIQDEKVVIDARNFRLTYYRNGEAVKSYPIAVGTPETPTPVGEWKIIHKGGSWGGGFGARWLGLNVPWGIYGIHGTNKPYSIGTRASHGCIRMFNQHVIELYSMVKVGTPVYILGNLPQVSLRREFQLNSSGKDVLIFQFALRKAGFDPGVVDGRFGTGTEVAVMRFQAFYGLTVTGKVTTNEQYLLGLR